MSHALLLSGSLGMGHDVMAEACAVSLHRRGWTSDTMDSLRLMGGAAGGLGERTFRALLAVPGVYDAFHFEQLRAGGRLARLAERASSRYAVPALAAELDRRPADLVVSVFATGAAATSRVKAERGGLVTAVFCIDVNPHSLWVHDNTDLYLVTSQTARRFVRRFHPGAEVAVVPTPVRPPFYAAPTQAQAREQLGLPADARCVLLMAGSWGMGPLVEIARALAAAGVHTLAVAGRNAKAAAALRSAAATEPRIVAFGFTEEVPTLMAAADAVLTTSGDTCSEARVVGRHVLLLDVVPGHGRENLQHELERGDADVVPVEPDALTRAVLAVLAEIAPPAAALAQTAAAWETAFDAALARVGLAAPVAAD
ncbi:MAG: glycosyl hydrolase [Actinobacteria bacterium]|nr:glycosyl hydrolase [Actinomycetota bacterium]